MNELSLEEIEKILIETKELGGRKIDITGGEPLIREDVEEIMKLGKKLGYKIELVTNSALLTKEKLLKFKEIGLDGVAISLDGSTPEKYNQIRRQCEKIFYRVIENIKLVKQFGFYTKVNTTVFECNLEDIENIILLAEELGADEIGLYYFTPIGRGNRSKELSIEPVKWLEFIRSKLKKMKVKIKVSLEFPMIEKENYKEEYRCIANNEQSHLQILPNGNVYPCAILASYNKPIANLHECSIKEIWENKELWRRYWLELKKLFKEKGNYCVCFKEAFDVREYKDHAFVCPLRKFVLEDI